MRVYVAVYFVCALLYIYLYVYIFAWHYICNVCIVYIVYTVYAKREAVVVADNMSAMTYMSHVSCGIHESCLYTKREAVVVAGNL